VVLSAWRWSGSSGQTNGIADQSNASGDVVEDGNGGYTLISDADPIGDVCSTTTGGLAQMSGQNIGDLLNAKGISWGFFEGGFDLTKESKRHHRLQALPHSTVTSVAKADYIPHHEPFQYYASTANPSTLALPLPGRLAFRATLLITSTTPMTSSPQSGAGNFPAVSFLKAPGYQDAHAGYSDPLDEQEFVVNTINFLQQRSEWSSTAVIIAYDDSDGWYMTISSARS